eukprot:TRINITY_DN9175_c0_g1_i23.p1 TRINITY_DN9175_c0_g1~~TRINITY_DN9175_c0_g1_i23.p1  ORF type:complete len:262 (-),score=60.66 TRINITY_DN9175_c0_g1_i23:18-803(-)
MNAKVVAKAEFPIEISCADFNPRSQIIALGFSNGLIKLLNPATFEVIYELNTPDPVMYLSCKLGEILFAGCSNSTVKTYTISAEGLNEKAVYLETDKTLRLFGLEFNESDKKLFVGYNTDAKSVIHLFAEDTSKTTASIKEETKVFKQFHILDKYGMLVCMEEKGLEFVIYDYNELSEVAVVSVPRTASSFGLLANTRQLRSVYMSDVESAPADDAEDSLEGNDRDIAYLFTDEGIVVTALLHSFKSVSYTHLTLPTICSV